MHPEETDELDDRARRVRDHLWQLVGGDPRVEQIGIVPPGAGATGAGAPVVRVHVIEDEGSAAEPIRLPRSVDGIEVVVVRREERARPRGDGSRDSGPRR